MQLFLILITHKQVDLGIGKKSRTVLSLNTRSCEEVLDIPDIDLHYRKRLIWIRALSLDEFQGLEKKQLDLAVYMDIPRITKIVLMKFNDPKCEKEL